MAKTLPQPGKFLVIRSLLVTGFGIGWLVGLSVSPVVSIVITSAIGSAAAIITALSGLEKTEEQPDSADRNAKATASWQVNPVPLALLVVGLIAGSILGIFARNGHWMGSPVSVELGQWVDATGYDKAEAARRIFELRYPYTPGIESRRWISAELTAEIDFWTQAGLPKEEAARRLLDMVYPTNTSQVASSAMTATAGGVQGSVLHGSGATECQTLVGLNGDALRDELRTSTVRPWRNLPNLITDVAILKSVVEQVLCAEAT